MSCSPHSWQNTSEKAGGGNGGGAGYVDEDLWKSAPIPTGAETLPAAQGAEQMLQEP